MRYTMDVQWFFVVRQSLLKESMNKYIWGMVWIFAACRGEVDPPVVVDIEQVDPSGQELVFWYQHTLKREDRLNDLLAEFNAGNVYGISVRGEYAGGYTDIYNKMVVGIQGGILPALVVAYNNQANAYFANGGAVDLAPYMSSVQWGLTAEARQDYYGDFLAQDRFDGVQVALPPNRSLELLYYNADWLRELGHHRPPEDWATFVALCRRAQAVPFSKNGSGRSLGWVLPADASHLASMVFGLGGGFIDEQQRAYTLDSPEVREALLMLRELVVDGALELAFESGEALRNFSAGKVLFFLSSSTGIPHVESAVAAGSGFNWQVAPLPHSTPEPVLNVYGASVAVCRTTAAKQLAAWLFLKWFTEPEQQARWAEASGYFPVRKGAAEHLQAYFAEHPRYEQAFTWLDAGRGEPGVRGYTRVRRLIAEAMMGVIEGEDMDTALADLQQRADATLTQ
ncbi:MAG TPA: extracellular solute-binding protein [Candidatus Handelsmanbacteria bacterium]|nr:extracellular solute-binding protein [Candidatus Handelsmanbacteria bacterium]